MANNNENNRFLGSEQDNIALIKRFVKEVWNDQRIEKIQEFMSPDVVIHREYGEFKGINTWKKNLYETLIKAIPDIRLEVEDIISNGEHSAVRWKARGVFSAELFGMQPSGEMIEFAGMTWTRIVNNKMVEFWTHLNMSYLIGQLLSEIKTLRGVLPLCSFCKKIRDDKGYWEKVDIYINKYSGADISHGICPECMKKNYPEIYASKNFDKNEE